MAMIFKRAMALISVVIMILLLFSPCNNISGAGTSPPHAINGYVFDNSSYGIQYAVVYVNNTRTNESIETVTDSYGRYIVDIEQYPSGYSPGDNINITAIYAGISNTENLTVNGNPVQQQNIVLDVKTHIIDGYVYKPDGTTAGIFSVTVTNQDKNESKVITTNGTGYYHTELSLFESSFSINDDITVYVIFIGFTGLNSSVVSENSSDRIDIHLSDIQAPTISLTESPTSIVINSNFQILATTHDNFKIVETSLFIKSPGDSIFTEIIMIQDNGAEYDWDSDGQPDINIYGQSTYLDIPLQPDPGVVDFYVQTTDGVFLVTNPATDPENNAHQIEVIDIIPPILSHTPITTLEAGETANIVTIAIDNLNKLDTITMHVKEVGQSDFAQFPMSFNGIPNRYNATMPAQNSLGYLEYFITCNDTSNNTVRKPDSGTWNVTVEDTKSPIISHVPINSANFGEPIEFIAWVEDATSVDSVSIEVNDVHDDFYNWTMTDNGDGSWSYTNASGQDLTNILNYTIWATDSSLNCARLPADTGVFSIQINDAGTPKIYHVAPEYLDYNVSNTITAYVEDNYTIESVSLLYEPVGGSGFINITMNSTDADVEGNGNYSATIPAQDLGTLRYYINATDGTFNITWPAIGSPHEIDVLDFVPPVISNLIFTNSLPAGTVPNILVNVTDNHQVGSVLLHYLNETSEDWISVMMNNSSNASYLGQIPAHDPGLVKFFITANDSSGNDVSYPENQPMLNPYIIEFFDVSIPEAVIDAPAFAGLNHTIPVFINVSDDQEVTSIKLYYNGTEDSGFSEIIISKIGTDNYKGVLPLQNHSGIVQIYAIVSDGLNNNQSQTYSISIINQAPVIEHTGVVSAPVDENVAMVAQVSDDLHVESVYFYWKTIDDAQYTNLTMSQISSGTYRTDMIFHEAVIIQYHIIAFDAENSSAWPGGPDHEISIMDLSAPEIVHTPLTQLNVTSMPIISATVTDNQAVSSVTLWFKNASASTFFSKAMSPVSGSQNMYSVILGLQPEGNFTYYIVASDGVNIAETEHYTLEVIDSQGDDWTPMIMLIIVIALLIVAMIIILVHFKKKPKPIKEVDIPQEK